MHTTPPLVCAWRGITLTVVRITDDVGHDWVEHAYPGRSGVELEDMGERPWRFEVEAVFFGPDWWADTLTFMSSVSQSDPVTGTGTFTHPFWGDVTGVITHATVTHEDRRHNTARVTASFVEAVVTPFAFALTTTLASAAAGAEAAQARATAALAALGA